MFPLKRTGQISRSRLRGFLFCQRMERAGLTGCVPKNGKSRFGKLFDKEMKLRYSDIYMKRSFSLCMEITGLPCFLAVLAQSDE